MHPGASSIGVVKMRAGGAALPEGGRGAGWPWRCSGVSRVCGVFVGSLQGPVGPGKPLATWGGSPKGSRGRCHRLAPLLCPRGQRGGAARAGSLSPWVGCGVGKKKGKMAFLSPFLSAEGVVGLWVLVVLWVLLGFVLVSSVFLLAVLSVLCQRG